MSYITSFEDLDREIIKHKERPAVLEALWDGDTEGWYLTLYLYLESDVRNEWASTTLGRVLIDGRKYPRSSVPMADAVYASKWGQQAAEKYGLTFYFPGSEKEDDCHPSWLEKNFGVPCSNCGIFTMPNSSGESEVTCYRCDVRELIVRYGSDS